MPPQGLLNADIGTVAEMLVLCHFERSGGTDACQEWTMRHGVIVMTLIVFRWTPKHQHIFYVARDDAAA